MEEKKKKERKEPWITEGAVELLELFMNSGHRRVLETGMGASTLYFMRKPGCRYLMSIEDDPEWYTKTLFLLFGSRSLEMVGNKKGHSFKTAYHDLSIYDRPYSELIEEEPDDDYDLILIDGRNRVKCIKAAIPKLRSGGWLVLDNSEREYYQPGIDLMKDWNRIDCRQQRPDKYGFTYPDWTTSIFIKP